MREQYCPRDLHVIRRDGKNTVNVRYERVHRNGVWQGKYTCLICEFEEREQKAGLRAAISNGSSAVAGTGKTDKKPRKERAPRQPRKPRAPRQRRSQAPPPPSPSPSPARLTDQVVVTTDTVDAMGEK